MQYFARRTTWLVAFSAAALTWAAAPSPRIALARSASAFSSQQSTRVAVPKIRKILQRGEKSELKRVLVKMQDNKSLVICFRVENKRYFITSEKKSHVYGDINAKGVWVPTDKATRTIIDIVKKIERDPVEYARSHGLKTGRCCFCSRKLTDPRSVTSGYGPVCAERYGMPWGKIK